MDNRFNNKNIDYNALLESAEFVVFSKKNCSYCVKAIDLLISFKRDYLVVKIEDHYSMPKFDDFYIHLKTLSKTFPMIFYKRDFLGGFAELKKKLDVLNLNLTEDF